MRLAASVFLAFASLGVAPSTAQQQPAEGALPPVRIDVVVSDRQGRPIVDLRPSDFELLENGSSKPITAVQFRITDRVTADVPPIETARDEEQAAREPGTRVFAFFLDEFHVSAGEGADRVRRSVSDFVDQKLGPRDLAVVMRPLDPVSSIRFTRDRAVLHGAIASFTGRKGDLSPRTPFEERYIGHAPATVRAARRQIVTAGLREVAMRLGELQADRGVVALFSEGFPADGSPSRSGAPNLHGVVRAASRFHLTFYAFNPAAPEHAVGEPAERERETAMLQWLAAQTGGRAVAAADFIFGLARLAHDTEQYYALSYQPARADGRFHAVEIRTKRRDLRVWARPGYWATLEHEWRTRAAARPATPSMPPRSLRRSPFMDAWIGLLRDTAGGARMVISWEPRVRGATSPQLVMVKARTTSGTALFDGRLAPAGSGSSEDSARFDVPAGRVQVDMTLLDARGKVLDTDVRDVDVPDLRGSQKVGPVLLATQIVRTRTVRDFQAASANPHAAPSSLRTFVRADRLLIRVPAFDPSGPAVRVTVTLMNRIGQPMREVDAIDTTPLEGVTQFALPLSFLAPGDYQIELTGTNGNGRARERLSFRVSG
jgi:VWFA-related protein